MRRLLIRFFVVFIILSLPFFFSYQKAVHISWIHKQENKTYKAMTYNIHRGATKFNIPSLNRILELIKKEKPDFIALQEVDRYHIRSGFQDQLRKLAEELEMYPLFGPNLRMGITEYGNAILSKYPIIDAGQLPLAYEKEPRSLLWAKVKTKDGVLVITSIHLGLDQKKRKEHFNKIHDFIEKNETLPILIMGDFNTLPDHPSFTQFRSAITGKLFHQEVTTYVKETHPLQIDYIIGKNIRELKQYSIPSNASDHFPVLLQFKFASFPYSKAQIHDSLL